MPQPLNIVPPPADIFQNKGFQTEPAKKVVTPMWQLTFDHVENEWRGNKGMYAFFKDCPFPQKGFPFPQAIHACNHAKRFFKRGMDALTHKNMLLLWLAFLISPSRKRILESWMGAYADSASFILEPYFVIGDRMTECAREIRDFLYNVFMRLEIDPMIARSFSNVFSTLIQYDDAYRLRIEDIANETTKEALIKHPIKEMERLVNILKEREPSGTIEEGNQGKFYKILKVLRILFWIPKFKRAFIETLKESNFKNFQMDDADRYHSMLRDDYSFFGLSIKERGEMYIAWHSVFPPVPPKTFVQLAE